MVIVVFYGLCRASSFEITYIEIRKVVPAEEESEAAQSGTADNKIERGICRPKLLLLSKCVNN